MSVTFGYFATANDLFLSRVTPINAPLPKKNKDLTQITLQWKQGSSIHGSNPEISQILSSIVWFCRLYSSYDFAPKYVLKSVDGKYVADLEGTDGGEFFLIVRGANRAFYEQFFSPNYEFLS